MARIRSIAPAACKSEKLDAVSSEAERCYWRLQPHCDDEGRAEDDPRVLRSLMFAVREPPLPAADVDCWLQELHDKGLIIRYEAGGQRLLQVTKWHEFQHPNRPVPSKFSAPTVSTHAHDTEDSVNGQGVESAGEGDISVELKLVSPPPATAVEPVRQVFDSWREATGHHKAVLDDKRRKAIEKALKHYPPEDLEDACRGVLLFPHNRGETNGTRYDDLALVLRDSAHIERFRDRYRDLPPPAPDSPPEEFDIEAERAEFARLMGEEP